MSDHSATISITVTLQSAPGTPAGFGVPTLFVDEAAGTGNGLNGDRYREYASVAEAEVDEAAGYITSAVVDAMDACFAQTRKVSALRVCRVDTGGGESYSDALTALENAGPTGGIWGLMMDSRSAATQVAFATAVQAKPYMLFLQSADSDWLTSGLPSGYANLSNDERTAVVYHDTAAQWADVAWACNRLAFDPDLSSQGSVQWECPLLGIDDYSTRLTSAQVANAKANNCAVIGELGSAPAFLDPGVSCTGRAIYEQLTADWFSARLREAMEALVVQQANRGRKILLNTTGQAMVLAKAQEVVQTAIAARHLNEGQVVLTTPPLTSADLDARRIRLEGEAQIAGSARLFVFDLYFTREQVVEDA